MNEPISKGKKAAIAGAFCMALTMLLAVLVTWLEDLGVGKGVIRLIAGSAPYTMLGIFFGLFFMGDAEWQKILQKFRKK